MDPQHSRVVSYNYPFRRRRYSFSRLAATMVALILIGTSLLTLRISIGGSRRYLLLEYEIEEPPTQWEEDDSGGDESNPSPHHGNHHDHDNDVIHTSRRWQQQEKNSPTTIKTEVIEGPPHNEVKRYFELHEEIKNAKKQHLPSKTAYGRATVIDNNNNNATESWFPHQKLCRETCCVETVAISLNQDATKIINIEDSRVVADVIIEDWDPQFPPMSAHRPKNNKYFANPFSNANVSILPCLLPGTIIFVQNDKKSWIYFWKYVRPNITVPYVIATAGSDFNSPTTGLSFHPMSMRLLKDPLLLKIYGTNPKYPPPLKRLPELPTLIQEKFKGIPLGLARQRGQERQILPYLEMTKFANPFLNKERFDLNKHPLQFEKDVFVHFNPNLPHRTKIWNLLCGGSSDGEEEEEKNTDGRRNNNSGTATASCNNNTSTLSLHHIYKDMSMYRFGVSPTGWGYDCYRTYEMLLLGIIPIVEARDQGESYDLYEGMPVIQMPNMRDEVASKQDFLDAIESYINSDEFQNTDFSKGWDRLFLKHNRHEILQTTGRIKDILVDPSDGREYYQAFRYSVLRDNPNKDDDATDTTHLQDTRLCPGDLKDPNNDCAGPLDTSWMETTTKLSNNKENQDWLSAWELLGGGGAES